MSAVFPIATNLFAEFTKVSNDATPFFSESFESRECQYKKQPPRLLSAPRAGDEGSKRSSRPQVCYRKLTVSKRK